MSSLEDIKILEKLGLTVVQSKVYLANHYLGAATAKQISKFGKIAREDIYRVMPALQKLGLVQKHLVKPAVFEAIPPRDVIPFLIKRRKKETEELSKKANMLIFECEKKTKNGVLKQKPDETIFLSCNEATFRRLVTQHEATVSTINVAMNWDTHKQEMESLIEVVNSTIKRGVTIRSIMDKPNQEFLRLPKSVQNLFTNPSYNVRFLSKKPPCRIIMFDDEVGFIVPSSVDDAKGSSSLWTNNPVLISLLNEYFESLWNTAKEIPYQELIADLKK